MKDKKSLEEQLLNAKKELDSHNKNSDISNKDKEIEKLTNDLRRYWDVDELKFIARFHRPKNEDGSFKNSNGYFHPIRNYSTKKYISYPPDENGKKENVFVYHKPSPQLIDGQFYYVEFVLAPKRYRKQNKYILLVKNVENIDQKDYLQDLLHNNDIKNNLFNGLVTKENGKIVMKQLISVDEGNLILFDKRRISALIPDSIRENLEIGSFYEFRLDSSVISKDNELTTIISSENIIKLDRNPYQEIIRLRKERLNNPESNKIIANLMREIGKGLYSSKKRMVFELLQNADDTPAGDEVSFHIDTHNGYFLIMHDGIPFNKDDVEAITSAANSTKRKDKKKTGYKGIGFKSVFTDSEEVVIKTGGFLFTFQRNYEGFNSFDDFYLSSERHKKYADILEEDKKIYKNQRKEFNGNYDIPWQLIPIWQKAIPTPLLESGFAKFNNNVGIAINFGKKRIKGYLDAIAEFTEKPHFLLFLRNVNTFKSLKNKVTIKKTGTNPVKLERISGKFSTGSFNYFIKNFSNVKITDEAILETGIEIYKHKESNDYGEITYYFSEDKEGKTKIESIPPKLAAFDNTTITFAAPILGKKLQAEPEYLNRNGSMSSLFTYLPMNEYRIQLPFLVNADFVPDSNREKIQGDNLWNEYLIINIAKYHIKWIEEIAKTGMQQNKIHKEYLSLLLKELIPEDFSAKQLIERYNETYLSTVIETAFIVSNNGNFYKPEQVIIDKSDLSNILGEKTFYEVSETEKRIPHSKINSKYLEVKYLKIQKFTKTNLVKQLLDETHREIINQRISQLDEAQYQNFLKWLNNDFYELGNESIEEIIRNLKFLKFGNDFVSWNDIKNAENDKLILAGKIKEQKDLFENLGFIFSETDLKDMTNIVHCFKSEDSYLTKESIIYDLITNETKLQSLSKPVQKGDLLNFILGWSGYGQNKINKLLLFKSGNEGDEKCYSLSKLISSTLISKENGEFISDFTIAKEEEACLCETAKDCLIKDDFFDKIIDNPEELQKVTDKVNQENLITFYNWIQQYFETNNLDSIALIATKGADNNTISWSNINEVDIYTNKNFPIDKLAFDDVGTIISSITDKIIPLKATFDFLNSIKENKSEEHIVEHIAYSKSFDNDMWQNFFTYLNDCGDTKILSKGYFSYDSENIKLNLVQDIKQYDTQDEELINYITNNEAISETLKKLPVEFKGNDAVKDKLLEDNELLVEIIKQNPDISFIHFLSVDKPNDRKLFKKFIQLPTVEFSYPQNTATSNDTPKDLEYFFQTFNDLRFDTDEEEEHFHSLVRAKTKFAGFELREIEENDEINNEGFKNWLTEPLNNQKFIEFLSNSELLKPLLKSAIFLTTDNELKRVKDIYFKNIKNLSSFNVPVLHQTVKFQKSTIEKLKFKQYDVVKIVKAFFEKNTIFSNATPQDKWNFIFDEWKVIEKNNILISQLRSRKILCKGENNYQPVNNAYIAKEYESNVEEPIEVLINELVLNEISFISDVFITEKRKANDWYKIFKRLHTKTDLQILIADIIEKLSSLDEVKHFKITQEMFSYWNVNKDKPHKQLTEEQLEALKNNLKLLTNSGAYKTASEGITIADEYTTNKPLSKVLQSVVFTEILSPIYLKNNQADTIHWYDFFKAIGIDEMSKEKLILERKLNYYLEIQEDENLREEFRTTGKYFSFLNELSELKKANLIPISKSLISKIKLYTDKETWVAGSNVHFSSIYCEEEDLDLQEDKEINSNYNFLHQNFIPTSISKQLLKDIGVKSNFAIVNGKTNYLELLKDIKYATIFWQKIESYSWKDKLFIEEKAAKEFADFIQSNACFFNRNNELKIPSELYSKKLEKYVSNDELLPLFDFSKLIVENKSIERRLGIQQQLTPQMALGLIEETQQPNLTENEVSKLKLVTLIETTELKEETTYYLSNANYEWIATCDLHIGDNDDFTKEIPEDKRLHSDFKSLANKFDINILSEDNLVDDIEKTEGDNQLISTLESRLKYIAFKITKSKENYQEKTKELREKLNAISYFECEKIDKIYPAENPVFRRNEETLSKGNEFYYINEKKLLKILRTEILGIHNSIESNWFKNVVSEWSESKIKKNLYDEFGEDSPFELEINESSETTVQTNNKIDDYSEEVNLRNPDWNHLSKAQQKQISEETRRLVQEKLRDLGYKFDDIGSFSIVNGVIDPNGIEVPLVIKSNKGKHLFFHPTEWLQLFRENSKLIVHKGEGEISLITLQDLYDANSYFQIDFDIEHFSKRNIYFFSKALQYVKNVHFIVRSTNYRYSSLSESFVPKKGEAGHIDTNELDNLLLE